MTWQQYLEKRLMSKIMKYEKIEIEFSIIFLPVNIACDLDDSDLALTKYLSKFMCEVMGIRSKLTTWSNLLILSSVLFSFLIFCVCVCVLVLVLGENKSDRHFIYMQPSSSVSLLEIIRTKSFYISGPNSTVTWNGMIAGPHCSNRRCNLFWMRARHFIGPVRSAFQWLVELEWVCCGCGRITTAQSQGHSEVYLRWDLPQVACKRGDCPPPLHMELSSSRLWHIPHDHVWFVVTQVSPQAFSRARHDLEIQLVLLWNVEQLSSKQLASWN